METIRQKQEEMGIVNPQKTAEAESTYSVFEKYQDFHLNEPIGASSPLPFQVDRTHKKNLPVYTDFKMGGQ